MSDSSRPITNQQEITMLYQHIAPAPLLSIIIIAHDDSKITNCINSAADMQEAEQVELVVVLDNSPSVYTEMVLAQVKALKIPVQLARTWYREPKGRLRDLGTTLATSSTLVFMDSDCTFSSDYVLQTKRVIGTAPIITGKVIFIPQPTWFSRENCRHRNAGYEYLHDFVRCPNLLMEKWILERIGGFEPVVDGRLSNRHERRADYGDDFLLNQTCYLAGYRSTYVREMVVSHHDDDTWMRTVRKWIGYGIGSAYRFKRIRVLLGVRISISSVLRQYRLPYKEPTLLTTKLFFLLYVIANNVGFLYGLWYWRKTTIVPLSFTPVQSQSPLWRT